ncbi:MAG: alpha/beta hydrolase [Spirochaetales bacterium]
MQRIELTLTAEDQIRLLGWRCLPDVKPPRACILILHGMAEHIQRYEGFSEFLCERGYAVYGFDLRGHGKTGDLSASSGIFAEENGWERVQADIDLWVDKIRQDYPESPLVLFGHSLGSLLARCYAARHGEKLRGMILSGPVASGGVLRGIASLLAWGNALINGKNAPARLLDRLIFRGYARSIKDRRTDFDWLSRDDRQVDAYIRDPHCGRIMTTGFYQDLLKGVQLAYRQSTYRNTPKDLPIYIFGGSKDPVGKFSRTITQLYKEYRKAGISNVTMKFYSGGRHEMLNETNREEVYKDILSWLNDRFPSIPEPAATP